MSFQKLSTVVSSGIVAAVAALSTMPASAAVIDKFFVIQTIQLCNDAGGSCATVNTFQAETAKIYEQAGVAPIFLPMTQLNSTALLTTTGVTPLDQPGNGQHTNSTVINAWYANALTTASGTLFGEAWVGGNGAAINASAVNSFNGGNGRRDTLPHEIGHNFGLRHNTFGSGGADNLMTSGSTRSVPNGVGNINPDGTQLSKLTANQITQIRSSVFVQDAPEVTVDTNGSTPHNTDDFFVVNFNSGAAGTFLTSMTLDLGPVNAFFDPTNNPPGLDGSPFTLSSLVGLAAADIAVTDGAGGALGDGDTTLKLSFGDNAFTAGDSFKFGIDIDLLGAVDFFGATPAQLVGMLFDFQFSNGFAGQTALDSDLITGSRSIAKLLAPALVIAPPGPGPKIPPGSVIDVPEPATLPIFLLGLLAMIGLARSLKQDRSCCGA
jgi:Metallo-peptidase family M12B Reprolysin-like/PEP-CTERM motif